jgi:hypothetical protein
VGMTIRRPLWVPICWWEDNIKVDLREREWGGMDWIILLRGRDQWTTLVKTVMDFRFE